MDASRLATLAERGDLAFRDPIVITRGGIVIDGYARWELAKRTGRRLLECIEHELSLEEALGELIKTHHPSRGLTDFLRIELALDLESHFQQRALANQQAGGKGKGSSKLTKAESIDVRREIAKLAGVSVGNVTKVKQLVPKADPKIIDALTHGQSEFIELGYGGEKRLRGNGAGFWSISAKQVWKKNTRTHLTA